MLPLVRYYNLSLDFSLLQSQTIDCLHGTFAQNVPHECLHAVRTSTLVQLQHYVCNEFAEHLSSLPVLDIAQLMLQVIFTEQDGLG